MERGFYDTGLFNVFDAFSNTIIYKVFNFEWHKTTSTTAITTNANANARLIQENCHKIYVHWYKLL